MSGIPVTGGYVYAWLPLTVRDLGQRETTAHLLGPRNGPQGTCMLRIILGIVPLGIYWASPACPLHGIVAPCPLGLAPTANGTPTAAAPRRGPGTLKHCPDSHGNNGWISSKA